ncbi:hypothetical protein GCM10023080_079140 [Streptomyces pseudoechinosporeus]
MRPVPSPLACCALYLRQGLPLDVPGPVGDRSGQGLEDDCGIGSALRRTQCVGQNVQVGQGGRMPEETRFRPLVASLVQGRGHTRAAPESTSGQLLNTALSHQAMELPDSCRQLEAGTGRVGRDLVAHRVNEFENA